MILIALLLAAAIGVAVLHTTMHHGRGLQAVDPSITSEPSSSTTTTATVLGATVAKLSFTIRGSAGGSLAPGVRQSVNLSFTNPNAFAIDVTDVSVVIDTDTTHPGCSGAENLIVTKQFNGPVSVPAHSQLTMSDALFAANRPVLTMPNLARNQDACKNATFALRYVGTATTP